MNKRFPVVRFNKLMECYRAMRWCFVIKENYLVLPGFIFWVFLAYRSCHMTPHWSQNTCSIAFFLKNHFSIQNHHFGIFQTT
uniref:Uncharacterized protein n=1 Tax=Lepeophtheirus salmonis TaxID=72036 RepID=A0A0K2UY33_LEPSM